jgi:hypothetical protein
MIQDLVDPYSLDGRRIREAARYRNMIPGWAWWRSSIQSFMCSRYADYNPLSDME